MRAKKQKGEQRRQRQNHGTRMKISPAHKVNVGLIPAKEPRPGKFRGPPQRCKKLLTQKKSETEKSKKPRMSESAGNFVESQGAKRFFSYAMLTVWAEANKEETDALEYRPAVNFSGGPISHSTGSKLKALPRPLVRGKLWLLRKMVARSVMQWSDWDILHKSLFCRRLRMRGQILN
jgi:hypothetical protein